MPRFDTVSVIGLGYVGLPTAAVIANRGIKVTGVDSNRKIVEEINRGDVHIVEPDLDILVRSAVTSQKLTAVNEPKEADVFIVAVPTPFTDGHKPDLRYLEAATVAMSAVLKKGDLVILESTSPVGTTEKIASIIGTERPDLKVPTGPDSPGDIFVVHSPERVLPGRVLLELVENDRVIGGISDACSARALEFYKLFVNGECLVTDARTAELVKLTENAYRDANIAFANEIAGVCEKIGVDPWSLIDLANHHPRVNILKPGPGVGGHCIAVDPWFIVDSAPDDTRLIQAARAVNDAKPEHVLQKILTAASERNAAAIACLGLAYKADIDDLRESPSLAIVDMLSNRFTGDLLVVEPNIDALPPELSDNKSIHLCSLKEALSKAQVVAVLTDHSEFKNVEPTDLNGKHTVDTRGIWHRNIP